MSKERGSATIPNLYSEEKIVKDLSTKWHPLLHVCFLSTISNKLSFLN